MAKAAKKRASPAPVDLGPAASGGGADRIELLHTFVRIVEAGSLSAAAAQLGTTQPTVSRRLQQLERALGRRLLHRSTHALKPSEDGERCYQRAKEVLAGWSEFAADLQGGDAEPEGMLRVVAPHAFGQRLLIGPAMEYLRRHPKVSIDWQLKDNLPDFVAEGVDCSILVGEASSPGTVVVRLAEVPRILVAAPSVLAGKPRPDHARDLAALPWLAFRTYYFRELSLRREKDGESCRIALRPRFSTDNLYALRSAALEGLGVALVSSWTVADDLASGDLVHVAPEWQAPPLPVYFVYPYARSYSEKLRRFVEVMRESVPAILGAAVSRGATTARRRAQ